jgi:hypothetical protein
MTFLTFGKKAGFDFPDFETSALRSWEVIEERLTALELPSWVPQLRDIMKHCISDVSTDMFRPKFGPGRVAERGVKGKIGKLKNFHFSPKIDRALFRSHISMLARTDAAGLDPLSFIPIERWSQHSLRQSTRIARIKFVPKNYKTYRTICMEPSVYMWAQQGVRRNLEAAIRNSSLFRFIKLKSQEFNQTGSLYGSLYGLVSTLDLSYASDSVSWELVLAIFPIRILYLLHATRSSIVRKPNGETVHVRKFAPMGSALCFPVQCLVYTCVAIYAAMQWIERNTGKSATIEEAIRFLSKPQTRLRVYGDDIVIDNRLVTIFVDSLTALGFTVNSSKSFTGSQSYRESCGKHHLEGDDVTPLYFKVKNFNYNRLTPESLPSLCAFANRAGDYGYKKLRSYIIHTIRRMCGRNMGVLFSADRNVSNSIYSTNPINDELRSRSNIYYQRTEVRSLTVTESKIVKPTGRVSDRVERYLYGQWVNAAYSRSSQDPFMQSVRHDAHGSAIRWRWTPTWD